MNWKHFLRGLGAGVIFSALIMLVAYMTSGSYRMSDDEVIARAEKLGMVMDDKSIVSEDKNTDSNSGLGTKSDAESDADEFKELTTQKVNAETTKETTTEATTEKITTEATTTEKATTEKTTTEKVTTEKATTEKATTEKATTEKATTEKATTEKATTEKATTEKATTEKTTTEEVDTQYVTAEITVVSGMGSEEIAKLVQDAGIIDDYRDFDNYLNNNGYSKKLSVNTFKLNSRMSYEEIAKELTKGDR